VNGTYSCLNCFRLVRQLFGMTWIRHEECRFHHRPYLSDRNLLFILVLLLPKMLILYTVFSIHCIMCISGRRDRGRVGTAPVPYSWSSRFGSRHGDRLFWQRIFAVFHSSFKQIEGYCILGHDRFRQIQGGQKSGNCLVKCALKYCDVHAVGQQIQQMKGVA
jgi:hypothetical protein